MRARLPWMLALLYAALFTWLGAWRYGVHRNFVDFGIFAQTIASAFGCFCNPIEGSHWAFHFSPILYLFGAIVALWHSSYALIVLSALGGALVIPPVYALVAARSTTRVAAIAACVAFFYPPLAGVIFNDFHENAFAPAAVLWAVWAFDSGRVWTAAALALVAMCVKEDQAIFMGIAGVAVALKETGTRRAAGIVVAACGALVLFSFFFVIAPHAQSNASWAPTRFYAWSASDLARLGPETIARLGFLVIVLLPLLFLPLRSPLIVLAIAPFAEVLFSRMSTTYTNGTHYAGAWAGYVIAAFAYAIRTRSAANASRLGAVCVILCLLEFAVANPLHPGLNLRRPQARDAALDAFLMRVPADADVATQEEAYTHLAIDHPLARLLPERAQDRVLACSVLIDSAFPASPRLEEYGDAFAAAVSAGRYAVAERDGTIALYRSARCQESKASSASAAR